MCIADYDGDVDAEVSKTEANLPNAYVNFEVCLNGQLVITYEEKIDAKNFYQPLLLQRLSRPFLVSQPR